MPNIHSVETAKAVLPRFDTGTFRLSRNAGTIRYIAFAETFAGTPMLITRVGSSNMPVGSALSVICRTTGPGSFRTGLNSYKQGTVVVQWQAWGIDL